MLSDDIIDRLNRHDHWPSRLEWMLSLIGDSDLGQTGRHLRPFTLTPPPAVERHVSTRVRNVDIFIAHFEHEETLSSLARKHGVCQTRVKHIVARLSEVFRKEGVAAVPAHAVAAYHRMVAAHHRHAVKQYKILQAQLRMKPKGQRT